MDVLEGNSLNICLAIRVQDSAVTSLPEGALLESPPERHLLKRSDGAVFLIIAKAAGNHFKRLFASSDVFLGLGFSWNDCRDAQPGELESIPDDPLFPVMWAPFWGGTLIQQENDSTVYVIVDGRKRPISSMEAFAALGYLTEQINIIDKELFASIPDHPDGPISLSHVLKR